MRTLVGPCLINCPEKCEVPAGVTLTETPPTRHKWGDMVQCPNSNEETSSGCERHFLVVVDPAVVQRA